MIFCIFICWVVCLLNIIILVSTTVCYDNLQSNDKEITDVDIVMNSFDCVMTSFFKIFSLSVRKLIKKRKDFAEKARTRVVYMHEDLIYID